MKLINAKCRVYIFSILATRYSLNDKHVFVLILFRISARFVAYFTGLSYFSLTEACNEECVYFVKKTKPLGQGD